jgi:RimJ/RimL family protein N-acetyltransferase
MTKNILQTERLTLREITSDDAEFMFKLMNDPSWLRFIGDRNITSIKASEDYISNKLRLSYTTFGFGFYLTSLKENDTPIGICGLVKRPYMEHVDVGFAFMPEYRSKGFGYESTAAILEYAKDVLGINYIVAITDLDNVHSIKLLEKLGLEFEKIIKLDGNEKECRLFVPINPPKQ